MTTSGSALTWVAGGSSGASLTANQTFTGSNAFSAGTVITNSQASNQFAGTFTGNGGGVTNTPMAYNTSVYGSLTSSTLYMPWVSANAFSTTEANVRIAFPIGGVLTNLQTGTLGTVIGSGVTIATIAYVNGSATIVGTSNTGSASYTIANSGTNTAVVTAGQGIDFQFKATVGSGPTTSYWATWEILKTP